MAYTSYLIRKFEYTHENQFFKSFSDSLEKIYTEKEGEHILIGNLSCNGHQMDAVFIMNGQISVIDFKDYEGRLTFSENNPWSMLTPSNGLIFVAGGARMRNPFQQVRAYRFSLMQYLHQFEKDILSENRNDFNWSHVGCFVLFQKPVEIDPNSIPATISRFFQISDIKSIFEDLDSKHSNSLEMRDDEIRAILKVLDVRPENLLEKVTGIETTGPKPKSSGKLQRIKSLIQGDKNDPKFKRLLNYYRTIVNVERFNEPSATSLYPLPFDIKKLKDGHYTLNLSKTDDFHDVFLKNLGEKYPKNLYVGLNIKIENNQYPLLHTIVLSTDIKNYDSISINLNDFELYHKSLEHLGLTEDIVDELNIMVRKSNDLEGKLQAICDQLSVSAEFAQTFQVGLSSESLVSVQLLSELRRLSELKSEEIKNPLFDSFLRNEKIKGGSPDIELKTFVQVTSLNQSQKKAIEMSFKQPLTLVTGPPGTGKSQVVLNLIVNAIINGNTVLFASKNNKAVDNVKERLDGLMKERFILRFGSKEEISQNAKPLISKFINMHNSLQFEDKKDKLLQTLSEIDCLNNRRKELWDQINKIDTTTRRINHLNHDLESYKQKFQIWLDELEPAYRSMFVESDLKLNIDKNKIILMLRQLDGLKKSRMGKFLFLIFYSSKFQSKVDSLNNGLPVQILEYVQDQSPWVTLNKDLMVSMDENLHFILNLKKEESSISDRKYVYQIEVEALQKEIQSALEELNYLKEHEQSYREEIEEIESKLPLIGISALNLYSENKLFEFDASKVQEFLDYLPIKELWKEEDLLKFNNSCKDFLHHFSAICATSLSIKNSLSLDPGLFDLLIIDEASQCDIASAIPLIFRAKKVVVIGDPLQLKHISSVQSHEEKYIIEGLGLGEFNLDFVEKSLYDYCYSLSIKSTMESVFLDEHYRCHPEIINFSSLNFYERKLGQSLEVKTKEKVFTIKPTGIHWIHVKGAIHQEKNINIAEANYCIDLANKLSNRYPEASIGIVTPFRDQYKFINDRIPESLRNKVKVDTVHKYQGDEKDIMIFSTLVTSGCPLSKAMFINKNDYLMNVAITRARNTLFIVGDFEYCFSLKEGKTITPLALLATYVRQLKKVVLPSKLSLD